MKARPYLEAKVEGDSSMTESAVRETPSPKTMRKLGHRGLALHWANVR